jgi:ABC-type dipeptide/oligopeptide/nickel transport system permease component
VAELIWNALPWTIGLLTTATVIAWLLGNLLGGLAGYYRNNWLLKATGVIVMGFHPVPYYVVAFVLLIVFGYLWPVLPIGGGAQINIERGLNPAFVLSVIQHSILPALSLILVGIGSWFMGMRALVSNIVTEDYVTYAEYAGVSRGRILRSTQMRTAGTAGDRSRFRRRDIQRRDHYWAGFGLASARCSRWRNSGDGSLCLPLQTIIATTVVRLLTLNRRRSAWSG